MADFWEDRKLFSFHWKHRSLPSCLFLQHKEWRSHTKVPPGVFRQLHRCKHRILSEQRHSPGIYMNVSQWQGDWKERATETPGVRTSSGSPTFDQGLVESLRICISPDLRLSNLSNRDQHESLYDAYLAPSSFLMALVILICITIVQGEFIVSSFCKWRNQGTEEIGPWGQSW